MSPTVPSELWGRWVIRRELPTTTITCWSETEARAIIGSEIEYSARLFPVEGQDYETSDCGCIDRHCEAIPRREFRRRREQFSGKFPPVRHKSSHRQTGDHQPSRDDIGTSWRARRKFPVTWFFSRTRRPSFFPSVTFISRPSESLCRAPPKGTPHCGIATAGSPSRWKFLQHLLRPPEPRLDVQTRRSHR
jgi:hypothetical protein